MAAPTNSGESDMATEDFFLNLSPLPSPRWSPLRLTPSPPRHFLPSSSSMVMRYQGCNQSMDNPPQNPEHDDMVDPPPYLAGDSALLQQQQQLRKNWSEASSDWRPRGGGIMTMNNQGFEESKMGFEESMEITTCFYFPPSPTNFPLYRPMPSVFFVSSEQENISLALSCQRILVDKSGALHVMNREDGNNIIALMFDGFRPYLNNKFGDLDQTASAAGVVPKDVESLVHNILGRRDCDEREMTLRRINWLEQHDEDIVDQPVYKKVAVVQQLIQNRGGELDVILGGGVFTVNGLERRDGQGSPMSPETLRICQAKLSLRVWLRHGSQWAAEVRYRWNRLNIGSFTTVEDAISAYEFVARLSRWTDLTGFPGLLENDNRSKLPLQLAPAAQEEKPDEDFGTEAVGIGSEQTGECILVDQARLNSWCLGKRKTKENNPMGERRNKKTNGVRITIPLEDISQTKGMRLKDAANHLGVSQPTLKYACREYGIPRWPPRKLISQSHPKETPALVDQEGIPQSNSNTLPSDQALAATVEKITSVVKEILPSPFSPTARQESLEEDFGNFEAEAVGIGCGGTWQSGMEEGQLNSRDLGKEKKKEMTPRGERRNKETTGVRISISLEEILKTKEMPLKDAAKHLKVTFAELMSSCREYGIQIWSPCNEHKLIMQPLPDGTPAIVNQEVIPQLTSHNVPSDQALMATVDTNSVVEKEIPLMQFLPIAQQENLDAGFGNDEAEAIGMGGEETREGVIEEAQLNSGCLKKQGKRKVNTPGGERGNNRTTGVRIAIPKEDILRTKGMCLKDVANHLGDFGNVEAIGMGSGSGGTRQSDMEEDQLNSRYLEKEQMNEMTLGGERRNKKNAISLEDIFRCKEMPQKVAAMHLKVSLSTLKRACRGHGIPSWPPCEEHNQSRPNESPAVVDKEPIPQLNSDTLLPSNQVSATIGTESVTVKARFSTVTMKFQLSWPWRMEELKQQVEKRLGHEAENYYICYKDQDSDDDLLIACDEDLQDHISHSGLPSANLIEVFLKPK